MAIPIFLYSVQNEIVPQQRPVFVGWWSELTPLQRRCQGTKPRPYAQFGRRSAISFLTEYRTEHS